MGLQQFYRLMPGFRGLRTDEADYDHWLGGDLRYDGGKCPSCRRPVYTIWDVNAQDPRFRHSRRRVFTQLARIPLLYCLRCWGELDYQILEENRIRVLGIRYAQRGAKDRFPANLDALPRSALEFVPVKEIVPTLFEPRRPPLISDGSEEIAPQTGTVARPPG